MWYVEWNYHGKTSCIGVFNTRAMARAWRREVTIWEPCERPRVTRNPVTPEKCIHIAYDGHWPL